ncbi:MAG: NTP transferase domain-containing protein [Candidatus Eremiobacteraeota bacterium]|nr:NTP transferase domain-containing protein [Candidatus Eremiobacteraeota bacterium]
MKITTVVLAGGPQDAVAKLQPGAANKAFITVGGKALVTRTLEALRAAPSIGRIIVVAPPSVHGHTALALADEMRPDGIRIRDSLSSGLRDLSLDEDVLVSASDLPILSTIGIESFLADAVAKDADLTYAILEKSVHESAFPQVPHTWARLRDGTYCGAGFITLRPRVYPLLSEFIERLGAARKNPLRLASLFGWDMVLRFALRRLRIAQAESRASTLLGACVRAVISTHPEMAVNVDRVSDVELAEQLVRERESTSG